MALRIRPLSEGASPSNGSGLRIKPLADFTAALPSAAGAPSPAPFQPDFAYTPASVPDPRMPAKAPIPADIMASLQGTAWATNTGKSRLLWDTTEGQTPIGPNTEILVGYEEGRPVYQRHPLFGIGTPAYDALVARWKAEGWAPSAGVGPGRISDTFTGDPTFQSMTNAQIRESFGHLAGRSPLDAAMNINPLSRFDGMDTPAGWIGLLGHIPAPFPATLIGPTARAMQQKAINDATPPTFEGFENAWQGSFAPALPTGLAVDADFGANLNVDAYHRGGSVTPGAPAGPERRAMLLEGEFVVRPEAAQKHRPLLEAINAGASTKKLRSLLDG